MREELQTTEELYTHLLNQKRPLLEEFKAKGLRAQERGEELSYSDFCLEKLTEAGLECDQLLLAVSLIDLGIAIGQIQVLVEVAKERRITHEYLIGLQPSMVSA
jgi:ketopantoate reductase